MDVSVSVSCFHDEIASTVERALKAAVDTVLWEITKTVGGRFAEKEKENEKLKLRLEMSERELRAMRECLIMSAARSPPSAASFSRTVQKYTEDGSSGTGTCVRVREPQNDPRVAEDRAFAAEQRPVLIEEVETKENLNCDEIGERAITDTGAVGKLAYQTTRPETETELASVKEEPNESVHNRGRGAEIEAVHSRGHGAEIEAVHSHQYGAEIETVHNHQYGAEIETVHSHQYGAEIETVLIKEELPELEYFCTEVPDSDHNNTRVHDEHSEPSSRPPVLDPGKSPQRRIAPAEKPHRCPDCGKRFRRLAHLRDHRRIHTGEKPFQCEDCGKRFSRLEHRKIHQRIHTGEKPYRCEACGKRFNQLSAFKTHLRIHTGEKPYRCEACGATFTYSQQLKAHRCQGPANSRENSHSDRADWKTPPHYGL